MKTNSLLIFPWEQSNTQALLFCSTSTQLTAAVVCLGVQHHWNVPVRQGLSLKIYLCGKDKQIWQDAKNSWKPGTGGWIAQLEGMGLQEGMLPEMGNIDSSHNCGEQVLRLLPWVFVEETSVCEDYAHVIA